LGYLREFSRIGQGYDQVLYVPGARVSFDSEVFGKSLGLGYPKSKKPGIGIPNQGKISQNQKTWNGISQN
jgi:hypothetical protein